MHITGQLHKKGTQYSVVKQNYTGYLWKAKNTDIKVYKTVTGTVYFRIEWEDATLYKED